MTTQQIKEIRERCEAASRGPWTVDKNGRYEDHDECRVAMDHTEIEMSDYEDAEFVAHARQDIPALLDEVERLQVRAVELERERDAVEQDIKTTCDNCELIPEAETMRRRNIELERERDAAVSDILELKQYCPTAVDCYYCAKYPYKCEEGCDFEWRGPKET